MHEYFSEAVVYSRPEYPDVVVGRLHQDAVEEVAPHVMRLVAGAYAAQFEPHSAPAGTFVRQYDITDEKLVAGHVQRMQTHMNAGSQYWLACVRENMEPSGLAKVAPHSSMAKRIVDATTVRLGLPLFTRPEVYVHDVITAPKLQRRGIGSLALHASLSYGNLPIEAQLTLDGYEGSPVNAWFTSLGFVSTNKTSQYHTASGTALKQRQFATPDDITLKDVTRRLEQRFSGIGYQKL